MTGYTGNTSTIDFGTPLASKMKNSSSIGKISLAMNNDFFWSVNVQAFAAGTNKTNTSYAFTSSIYSIFDSGTSQILVPSSVFTSLIETLVVANGNPEYQLY
jgi:hypothetical protein